MLCLLLSVVGIVAAQLSSTPQTATIFKTVRAQHKDRKTLCEGRCRNTTCLLNNQNLEEMPACVPHSVERLDLSCNKFTVFWEQNITDLFQLQILSLAHNQIKEVLWKSNVLPQLEVLDLSHNRLEAVPKCLLLKNMKWFSLAGNPISHIGPFAFTSFPNLEFLNLSSTLLGSSQDIEESAFALNLTLTQEDSLRSLQQLDLSDTYFQRVGGAWSKDLPNLKKLYLRNLNNMESLEEGLIQWFPYLEVLNCTGSRALTGIMTEIFRNASELKYLSFRNCKLTSFPPWNVTSGSIHIDLSGNPLICNCELSWLFSDPSHLTLIRPHETFCNSVKGDTMTVSLLEHYNFCQRSKGYLNQNMSTPAVTNTDTATGKHESSVTVTPTPQNVGKQPYIPETVTVFKATVADLENSSTKQSSSSVQEKVTLVTETGFTNSSTTVNSFAGTSTSSTYTTASTLVTSKGYTTESTSVISNGFTSPARTTRAGSGQPLTEDSSNEEQGNIPRDYSEDYDDVQSQPDRSKITSTTSACDYDGCRHLQIPCIELQRLKPCSCPGLSGDNVIPDAPYLKNMSEITDTSAQIHWCAPNSKVDKYELMYQPVDGHMKTVHNIYVTMRQYTLYDLTPFTSYKICILAFNRAGQSAAENKASGSPCTVFQTKPSYIMILALVGSLCGVFLVIIAGLAVLLCRTYKNSMVNQYDTRLVSYKNPAFEYHLTIPSYH